jgi:hypothetical protein
MMTPEIVLWKKIKRTENAQEFGACTQVVRESWQ